MVKDKIINVTKRIRERKKSYHTTKLWQLGIWNRFVDDSDSKQSKFEEDYMTIWIPSCPNSDKDYMTIWILKSKSYH